MNDIINKKIEENKPVYLEYPYEEVMIRLGTNPKKVDVYRKFYGEPEQKESFKSNVVLDCYSYGKEITKEQYEKGKPTDQDAKSAAEAENGRANESASGKPQRKEAAQTKGVTK